MLEGAKGLCWIGQFDIPDADRIASTVWGQGPRKEGAKGGAFRTGLYEGVAICPAHDGTGDKRDIPFMKPQYPK